MIDFDFSQYCYGCSACANICKNKAIQMKYNQEGFLIPVINECNCTKCGMCKIVCPYYSQPETNCVLDNDIVLSAYRKKNENAHLYTSSGIFRAVAERVFNHEGMVCACIWDDMMQAKHVLSNDRAVLDRFCYSKYVQSDIGNCYKEIEIALNNNVEVLFCGTPCQVAGLYGFLRGKHENLFCIAIVCHGVPAPLVWKEYKKRLERKMESRMIDANFRVKGKYGWITPCSVYKFANGKQIKRISFSEDPYMIAFGTDIMHRNSCYNCKFKGTNCDADIVTGDYWGCNSEQLKTSQNKGISFVIVHTPKGREMIEKLNTEFEFGRESISSVIRENRPVIEPVIKNTCRSEFFTEFASTGEISYLYSIYNKKQYVIKRILYKLKIYEKLKIIAYYLRH